MNNFNLLLDRHWCELLAVIGNNQSGQFPYIILLGQTFNDGNHSLRFADYGKVVILTGSVRNISYKKITALSRSSKFIL